MMCSTVTWLARQSILRVNEAPASVICCPLAAMLTVEDEAFWQDVEAVRFGTLPRLQEAITVIG